MLLKFILFTVGLVFTGMEKMTAQPDWEVIPQNYQFTMSLIGVAVYDCEESMEETDLVAAFIDGEVRGVETFDTDIQGRKYTFMIIYDNDFSGNEISFKLYDASEDEVIDVVCTTEFHSNSSAGEIGSPFELHTAYPLQSLHLSKSVIPEAGQAGDIAAELYSMNKNGDTLPVAFDFINDAGGPDNAYFSISNHLLILEVDVNIALKNSYQIHISGVSDQGCAIDSIFTITAGGVTALNDPAGTESGISIYPNPADTHLYFETEEYLNAVRFYDVSGRLVLRKNISPGENSIEVSGLSEQLYVVVFRNDKTTRYARVFIKH